MQSKDQFDQAEVITNQEYLQIVHQDVNEVERLLFLFSQFFKHTQSLQTEMEKERTLNNLIKNQAVSANAANSLKMISEIKLVMRNEEENALNSLNIESIYFYALDASQLQYKLESEAEKLYNYLVACPHSTTTHLERPSILSIAPQRSGPRPTRRIGIPMGTILESSCENLQASLIADYRPSQLEDTSKFEMMHRKSIKASIVNRPSQKLVGVEDSDPNDDDGSGMDWEDDMSQNATYVL